MVGSWPTFSSCYSQLATRFVWRKQLTFGMLWFASFEVLRAETPFLREVFGLLVSLTERNVRSLDGARNKTKRNEEARCPIRGDRVRD